MSYHEGGTADAAIFRVIEPKENKLYFEYGYNAITAFDYKLIE